MNSWIDNLTKEIDDFMRKEEQKYNQEVKNHRIEGNKRFTYYCYDYDGDGGDAITFSKKFKPVSSFYKTREKIGDFNTAEELATLAEISVKKAEEWIQSLLSHVSEEDY